jgi:hypothetical protein
MSRVSELSKLSESYIPHEITVRVTVCMKCGENADLGPREEMTDQDQDVTTAVHHRPRRDWGRVSILYVAAFFGSFIILFSAFSFR